MKCPLCTADLWEQPNEEPDSVLIVIEEEDHNWQETHTADVLHFLCKPNNHSVFLKREDVYE